MVLLLLTLVATSAVAPGLGPGPGRGGAGLRDLTSLQCRGSAAHRRGESCSRGLESGLPADAGPAAAAAAVATPGDNDACRFKSDDTADHYESPPARPNLLLLFPDEWRYDWDPTRADAAGPAQPDCGVGKVSYLPRAEIGCCQHGYH